jgi:hypothetical protein
MSLLVTVDDDVETLVRRVQSTVRAAQNAAKSPHGLVNLIRLIASLDAAATDLTLDDEDDCMTSLSLSMDVVACHCRR